jgi:hypothetical protein
MTSKRAVVRRLALAGVLGAGLAMVALPHLAWAADPSATPDIAGAPAPTVEPAPTPTPDPTPTPTPDPTPEPTPNPPPVDPRTPPGIPETLNLFAAGGFQYQDPNWAACTAASARTMLNFIAARSSGGEGFVWRPTNSGVVRDSILAWERRRDTLPGGYGSDPHGWRNALNYYGWGVGALYAGSRVYDDFSFTTFDAAVKATVRALVGTGKPVGVLGWRGAHAQMITGYWGLAGDPFAKDADGRYTNAFTVSGFYLTDPLRESRSVNRAITYRTLQGTTSYRLRFQRFYETDSRFDDPYTPGYRVSRTEWYGKFVLVLPIR